MSVNYHITNAYKAYEFSIGDAFFLLSLILVSIGHNQVVPFYVLYVLWTVKGKMILSKDVLALLLLSLLSGTFLSFYNLFFGHIPDFYRDGMILRNRYFVLHIIYAMSVGVYLSNVSASRILRNIYLYAMINCFFGLFQLFNGLLVGQIDRIKMLSFEPSSAAMLFAFISPLLILYLREYKDKRFTVYLFFFIGLFILSKALVYVYFLWLLIFFYKSEKKVVLFLVIALFAFFIYPSIQVIDSYKSLVRFYEVLINEGLYGLNEKNQIWTSFSYRISGALIAIKIFIENIFGVGFGVIYYLYNYEMSVSEIGEIFSGEEIRDVLNGINYSTATTKSIFFEYLVSCGLFFLVPFLCFFKRVFYLKVELLLKVSFYSLALISLMVELAPYTTYLVIVSVLINKYYLKEIAS